MTHTVTASAKSLSDEVCIVGVGQTEFNRGSGISNVALATRASLLACADAGLDPSEIDGILPPHQGTSACAEDLMAALRIRELRYTAIVYMGGASAVASLQTAAIALASGLCNYVLAVRARNGFSERTGSNAAHLISILPGSDKGRCQNTRHHTGHDRSGRRSGPVQERDAETRHSSTCICNGTQPR